MEINVKQFITEIENRPIIWDTRSEEYSNRELKKKCWEQIVELFDGQGLSSDEKRLKVLLLQKRWKNLRGCFTRELHRMRHTYNLRKSQYVYFNRLLFLRDAVSRRTIKKKHQQQEHIKQEHIDLDGIEKDDVSPSPESVLSAHMVNGNVSKKMVDMQDQTTPSIHQYFSEVTRETQARERALMEDDEDRLFLLSLHSSLKSIPTEHKLGVKIQLMRTLQEALCNH